MNETDRDSNDQTERAVTNSKIARVIAEYGLDGVGDTLERRWTADDNKHSLRELADWFNVQVLQSAMEEAGSNPLEGEVQNIYELLRDDEASSGSRLQARKRLERRGIDVDTILTDFASHQAVHTYLTKYRRVSHTPRTETDSIEKQLETIQRLQSRTAAVTGTIVDQLEAAGEIETHDIDVIVDVRVLCRESGSQYPITEYLENGGCENE